MPPTNKTLSKLPKETPATRKITRRGKGSLAITLPKKQMLANNIEFGKLEGEFVSGYLDGQGRLVFDLSDYKK